MPVTLKQKTPTAQVEVVHTTKGQVVTEQHVEEQVDEAVLTGSSQVSPMPFCEVGFEASMTRNLGNYNSVRCQVSLRVPCPHGEIDETYEYVEKWVNDRMEKLQAELGET